MGGVEGGRKGDALRRRGRELVWVRERYATIDDSRTAKG